MNAWASARGMFARSDSPKSREPVGDPEVDHLGHRPLAEGDVGRVLVEHERGRLAVEVGLAGERVAQVLVARHVGEDAQLDLAVVGGHQRQVVATGHERARGCAGRAGSGSGCSGGSGRTRRGGRSPRRPGGTSCGGGRRRRSASAARRRRSSAASCRSAIRGACRSSDAPAAGPRAPTRRSSSRSWSACPSAG